MIGNLLTREYQKRLNWHLKSREQEINMLHNANNSDLPQRAVGAVCIERKSRKRRERPIYINAQKSGCRLSVTSPMTAADSCRDTLGVITVALYPWWF